MMGLSGSAVIQEKDPLLLIYLLSRCHLNGSDESDLSCFCVLLARLCKSISPLEPECCGVGQNMALAQVMIFLTPAGISGQNR